MGKADSVKHLIFTAVLLAFTTRATAQLSQHPATRPAVAKAATSKPLAKPVLTLKAGAPKDVSDFYDAYPTFRDGRIKGLESAISLYKKTQTQKASAKDLAGVRDIKKQIIDLNAQIDAIKSGSVILAPPLGAYPMKEGDFFGISCKAVVFQVVDGKTFILQYVDQSIPPEDGYAKPNALMWLSGISTAGFVDGADFNVKPEQVFRMGPTKTYGTAIGSQKTIVSAVEVDYKPYITADTKK